VAHSSLSSSSASSSFPSTVSSVSHWACPLCVREAELKLHPDLPHRYIPIASVRRASSSAPTYEEVFGALEYIQTQKLQRDNVRQSKAQVTDRATWFDSAVLCAVGVYACVCVCVIVSLCLYVLFVWFVCFIFTCVCELYVHYVR
jgi:hypothetical protein